MNSVNITFVAFEGFGIHDSLSTEVPQLDTTLCGFARMRVQMVFHRHTLAVASPEAEASMSPEGAEETSQIRDP